MAQGLSKTVRDGEARLAQSPPFDVQVTGIGFAHPHSKKNPHFTDWAQVHCFKAGGPGTDCKCDSSRSIHRAEMGNAEGFFVGSTADRGLLPQQTHKHVSSAQASS